MSVAISIVLGNVLAPMLFAGALHFRKGLCAIAGSKTRALYSFALAQVVVTIARYLCLENTLELGQDWTGFAFPGAAFSGYLLCAAGQILNLLVYYKIGIIGVYYGAAFGFELEWCTEFPFSVISNPQYVGVTASTLGSVLLHGVSLPGLLFVGATILQYVIIVTIERHYFGEIDRKRALRLLKGRGVEKKKAG